MKCCTLKGRLAIDLKGQKDVVAGYIRVSTDNEDQANALVVQRDRIERENVDVIYEDVMSGAVVDRPGYDQLKVLIYTGQVTKVIITNVSRLGRDIVEALAFVKMCDERGVVLQSLCQPNQPLTLANSTATLMAVIPMALAHTGRLDIKKKVLDGFEGGRKMGKPMRKPCWGYDLSKDKMRCVPSSDFDTARRFIEFLKEKNWRMRPALKEFPWPGGEENRPFNSCTGVRAWLLNPTIRGGVAYGQVKNHKFTEILWDRHEPLMSHEEFQEFDTIRKLNAKMWGHNAQIQLRPLTSLCTCSECGRKMTYVGGRTFPSVRCKGELCSQHFKSTREDKIIEALLPKVIEGASVALAEAVNMEVKEDPRVGMLELQVAKLAEHEGDPIFDEAIRKKKEELAVVKAEAQQQKPDAEVFERLANPLVWEKVILPDRNSLTVVLHNTVQEIEISKQSVGQIRLKL